MPSLILTDNKNQGGSKTMDEKYMKIKKIIVPTITMAIIASQLLGCNAVSQSELLQMINNGDMIEIEVAVPINQEQGNEQPLNWEQLDQLTTQPELRADLEDIYKIYPFGDNSKNGIFYVNVKGEQDGNNTLYNTFANGAFRNNYWNDEIIQLKVVEAVAKNYVDIEADDSRASLAAINAYFNILKDAEPGYANMDSTLNRLEAMSAIFRAENPVVDDLTNDDDFQKAVDPSNSNEDVIFASNLSEQSYLDIDSQSLDELTAKGTITRGELVYMIVQQYFPEDYKNVDLNAECYTDAKNGGNIAEEQKFIENATSKPHWQAYELTYALQNPDKGCPERMYKALVVAHKKNLINSTESRWDEAVTKSDFLEILTNAYLALPIQFSAMQGSGIEPVEEVAPEEPTQVDEGNLQIDALGVDGTTEEDEYDETRDNLNIKPTEETSTEKITLEPDENGEITVTQEEADAIAKQLIEELMKEAENTTPQTPQYDYSKLPEGCTPDNGVLPPSNFDPSVQAPAGRLE